MPTPGDAKQRDEVTGAVAAGALEAPARARGARAGARRTGSRDRRASRASEHRAGGTLDRPRLGRPPRPSRSGPTSRTSRWVASLITISPAPAACASRRGPSERLPAHEPLGRRRVALEDLAGSIPMRTSIATARSCSSSSFRWATASRSSSAARTARRASSSCSLGTPKIAARLSPSGRSRLAPWSENTCEAVVK